MNLIVDGLHISGLDEGKGPVALLLHGWGNDYRALLSLARALKERRLIAPDLPGFGGSQPPKEAWGIEDYAQFVVHLLTKLEVDKVDLLIGHSFGGRIALVLTGQNLISLNKLVLVASHGLPEPTSWKSQLLKGAARAGRILPARLRHSVGRSFRADDYRDLSGVMRQTFQQVVNQDATADARAITRPTLLIYGSEDTTTPTGMGRQLSDLIEGSSMEVIAGAGHDLPQDQPQTIAKLIKEFAA